MGSALIYPVNIQPLLQVTTYPHREGKKKPTEVWAKKRHIMENEIREMMGLYFLKLPIYIFPLLNASSLLLKFASHKLSTQSSFAPLG